MTVHLVSIEYDGPFIIEFPHHIHYHLVDEILVKGILCIDHDWNVVIKCSFTKLVYAIFTE